MADALPTDVVRSLISNTVDLRSPAYFRLDTEGRVQESGGQLDAYGVAHPKPGDAIADHVVALHGMFPTDEPAFHLYAVDTGAHTPADVHVVRSDGHHWVVLLDASASVERLQLLQQARNARTFGRMGSDGVAHDASKVATDLLEALDVAVLEPADTDALRLIGRPPAWFLRVWPEAERELGGFRPQDRSPFLEHFLEDAKDCWAGRGETMRHSGVWTEVDGSEREWYLHATAVRWADERLLLVKDSGTTFAEQTELLQRARENVLRHHALKRETEKRDVLLGYIVHDLRAPLMSISSALELLDFEIGTDRGKELIKAALAQITRQDLLIRSVLDTFASDLEGLNAAHTIPVDGLLAARTVGDMFEPLVAFRRLRLLIDYTGEETGWWVQGHRVRLERVLANLVENAIRHSPQRAAVRILLRRDGDNIAFAVEDEGPGVPKETAARLFERFAQTGTKPGTAGLGLHFCRVAVEGWGGTIGHEDRPGGGSRFWFRLARTRQEDLDGHG